MGLLMENISCLSEKWLAEIVMDAYLAGGHHIVEEGGVLLLVAVHEEGGRGVLHLCHKSHDMHTYIRHEGQNTPTSVANG